jgi:hypothetical protein
MRRLTTYGAITQSSTFRTAGDNPDVLCHGKFPFPNFPFNYLYLVDIPKMQAWA